MKKSFGTKILKSIAALFIATGMIFSAVSCDQTADEIIKAITGDETVDNLLSQVKTGTYKGKLTGVTAETGNKKVTFTWTNPTDDDFAGVSIYKDTNPLPIYQAEKEETSAVIDNLENGQSYTFTLLPMGVEKDGSIKVGKNPSYKTVTPNLTEEDKLYVGKITDLTWVIGDEKVTFAWTNPTESNFAGVKVYVGDELYATTNSSEDSVVIEGLENEQTYTFQFRACGKNALGIEVDSENVVTKRLKLDAVNMDDYLGELSNINVTNDDSSATFTWENPNDANFAGVAVYCNNTKYEDLDKDVTSYTFKNLEPGTYVFKLAARGKNRRGIIVESLNPATKKVDIILLTKYGYIGRGYNVVTGEYFSPAGTGLKAQIVQLSPDFIPANEKESISNTKFSGGKSFTSYKKDWNASVGLEAEYGGFAGSVSADFGGSSEYSEDTSFANASGIYSQAVEYFLPDQIDNIKNNLTAEFINSVNNDDIDSLFSKYGTHILLTTTVGGRFSVNYTCVNTSGMTSSQIKAAASASYGAAKVSGSTESNTSSEFNNQDVNVKGYAIGGQTLAPISSLENFNEILQTWSESLNDEDTWRLIDAVDTIANENKTTGVWLYANDPARQNAIKARYLELLANNKSSFAAKQVHRWVKSVHCYDNGPKGIFKDMINTSRNKLGRDADIEIVGQFAAAGADESMCDILRGIPGANYVYLLVEYTTNKDEALRGLIGNSSESATNTENVQFRNPKVTKNQWTKIDVFNRTDGANYRHGSGKKYSEDGYRVIFTSKTQNRDGTMGSKAYPIKEVVIWNSSASYSTASKKALQQWKFDGDGNNVTTETGGDDIFFRLYYDPEDIE